MKKFQTLFFLRFLRFKEMLLPAGLLALYALNALADTFPLTATAQWLNTEIRMSQATQSMFYAAVFVPYSFKPIYGWLSEALKPYFARPRLFLYVAATLCEACLYVVCGMTTRTVSGAFGTVLSREIFAACAEMMLSACLADAAAREGGSAARAQSEATAARWGGTIAAYGLKLWTYRCGSSSRAPNSRLVLSSNAAILLPAALVAFVFGEKAFVGDDRTKKDVVAEEPKDDDKCRKRAMASCLVVAQVACAWVAVKDLMVSHHHRIVWRWILYALGTIGGLLYAFTNPALCFFEKREDSGENLGNSIAAPSALILSLNAAPTAGIQISNLELYLFFERKPCFAPYSELAAAASSVLGCVFFSRVMSTSSKKSVASLTLLSAVASLAYSPLAKCADGGRPTKGFDAFTYDVVVRALDAFCSELALLARTSFVLSCALAVPETSGSRPAIYGSFLALADAGASMSGWISAPLVAKAGITYGDFHRLPWLLEVCSLVTIVSLAPLPFVRTPREKTPPENPQENYAPLQGEDSGQEEA